MFKTRTPSQQLNNANKKVIKGLNEYRKLQPIVIKAIKNRNKPGATWRDDNQCNTQCKKIRTKQDVINTAMGNYQKKFKSVIKKKQLKNLNAAKKRYNNTEKKRNGTFKNFEKKVRQTLRKTDG